jgi:hypothetical protein
MYFFHSLLKLFSVTTIYSLLYNPIEEILNKNSIFIHYKKDRKNYIIKNLIKSVSMFVIFIHFLYIIFNIDNPFFNNSIIRNYGALYVGNDIGGLIMVKNLPNSTKLHHIISLILFMVVSYFDVNKHDFVNMITIYTIFSFIPFCVNSYLALRFFVKKNSNNKQQIRINKLVDLNRIIAKNIYLTTCFINWSIHIYYYSLKLYNYKLRFIDILYMLFLIPIINDDIILLKWLNKKLL